MTYFYAEEGLQRGPVDDAAALLRAGVRADTLVWRDGLPQWVRADAVPELADHFGPAPVDATPAAPAAQDAPIPIDASVLAGPAPATGWSQPLRYESAYGPGAPPSGMAQASMILGIVALVGLFGGSLLGCVGSLVSLPCGILALVFGLQARAKANRGEAGGRGMALAGIITGSVALGLIVLGVLAMVAFVIAAAATA